MVPYFKANLQDEKRNGNKDWSIKEWDNRESPYDHGLTKVIQREVLDKHIGTKRTIKEIVNGSMAPNLEEMKEHGKAMEKMKTNSELKNDGLVPDPIQD